MTQAGTTQAARPVTSTKPAVKRSSAVIVYLLLLVALQVFLLVVAVEGLLGDEPDLARNAAILSLGLFGSAIALRWFVGER